MRPKSCRESGTFHPRLVFAFGVSSVGLLLGLISLAAIPSSGIDISISRAASLKRNGNPPAALLPERRTRRRPATSEGNITDVLESVNCISSSDCWAVGHSDHGQEDVGISIKHRDGVFARTLIEHWDGVSWLIVPSPNIVGTDEYNKLQGVTCTSSSDCWAVGFYCTGNAPCRTLTEHWNGTSWLVVDSANTSANEHNFLYAVTCISGTDCWAVGYYLVGSGYQTLIEHWNGTSWSITSSPNAGTSQYNLLRSVTCTSAFNCWVVGYGVLAYRTLIEHWDGISWSLVDSPSPSASFDNLYSVTCVSAEQCWAVGLLDIGNAYTTFTQKWDGDSWTVVSSPNATGGDSLNSVTCVSASNCWAVGSSYDDSASLVEHWDGNSWSIVASPNVSPGHIGFHGVSCVSAVDCWGVGVLNDQVLTEHWDGGSWAIVKTPPVLEAAASRKMHDNAGEFDVDLPLTGNPGIECRSGGLNALYYVIFTFMNDLTDVTGADSNVGGVNDVYVGPKPNQCTVELFDVPNAQFVTVTIDRVQDTTGRRGDVSATMTVLVGDTNENGSVNSADVAQTKSRIGQPVDPTNFRSDVNANGVINASDIGIVKSNIGTALP